MAVTFLLLVCLIISKLVNKFYIDDRIQRCTLICLTTVALKIFRFKARFHLLMPLLYGKLHIFQIRVSHCCTLNCFDTGFYIVKWNFVTISV